MRLVTFALGIVVGAVFSSIVVLAWTGPTATAPGNNVSAPLNVGSAAQTKNGNLGVNGLAVFGNSILQASSYLNWGATAGTNGYGIWDNAGTLEFKNSGGSWASIQSTVASLVGTSVIGGSGTTNDLAKFTSANQIGNSFISQPSAGTLSGFNGGVGIGNVSKGWYSDGTNLAARAPSTSGGTYFQDNNGARTWAIIGANVSGIQDYSNLNVSGSATVSGVIKSNSSYHGGIGYGTLQNYNASCTYANWANNPIYCTSACNRYCKALGSSGGVAVEGDSNVIDCLCIP